jgi:hypothetical protein
MIDVKINLELELDTKDVCKILKAVEQEQRKFTILLSSPRVNKSYGFTLLQQWIFQKYNQNTGIQK